MTEWSLQQRCEGTLSAESPLAISPGQAFRGSCKKIKPCVRLLTPGFSRALNEEPKPIEFLEMGRYVGPSGFYFRFDESIGVNETFGQ